MNKINDYVIAIPSYKRHTTLNKKTLSVLKDYKINPKKIFIFVANDEEKNNYEELLNNNDYNKIVIGKPGIQHIRNFMPKYFNENQYIVYMDDDISKINICKNLVKPYDKKNNKLEKLPNLDKFIKDCFKYSEKKKIYNWGVYPVDNPYFMKATTNNKKDYVSEDLKFLIGYLTGVKNNRKAEIRTIGDKEDYERTIKYYLKDNGVLRYNNICCNTKCYKEPGGIQAMRKKEDSRRNALKLMKDYPYFVSINNSRKSGFVEIRLRDKTKSKSFNKKTKKHKLK